MSWTKNESVVWEEMDGVTLLIDTKSGTRWTLSATASSAWNLCDGKRTLAEMANALHESRESIAAFCEQFETLGLLQCAGAEARTLSAHSAQFSIGKLRANYFGKGFGGPRRRPSPRGNSGPG